MLGFPVKPTLTKKIGLLLLLPFLGSFGGTLVFSAYLERTRNAEDVVNVAGRQRLLAAELRDWTYMVSLGQDDDRAGLKSRILAFDRVLAALQRGGRVLDAELDAVPPELRPKLTAVAVLWGELRPDLRTVAATPRGDARFVAASQRLDRELPRLRDVSDRFVVAFVARRKRQQEEMRWTLGFIATASFVIFAIGLILTRRFIVRPIIGLDFAARRIHGGDFSVRLDFSSRDELGSLAGAFNEMVEQVEKFLAESREASDRVEASERNFRELAELAPAGIFRRDTNFRLVFGNATFFGISGLAATETGHDDLMSHLHPDDRAAARLAQEQALREPTPPVELRYVHADGTMTWVLDRAAPQVGADGTVTGIMGTLTDITAIKNTEVAIREQAALLDLARDAIIERGLDRRVVFWNDGATRLYGWSREEALGQRTADLLVPSSALASLDDVWESVLRHGEWHGEMQLVAHDGRKLVVESSWTLVRDAAGQPKAALSIDTDVTERRALETQMYRSQRMESIGTMAGGIAHDLNNVLQPILLSVGVLKIGVTDPQQLAILELLSSNAQRGADLIRQVLTFARGTEGERAPVHVELIVRDAIRIVRETVAKDIHVRTELADGIWTVSADATQLHQVVMNLCLNAADAMPDGGTITVSVENTEIDEQFARMRQDAVTGSYVTLRISDTGTGMSAEVLDRIFEPFFTTKGTEKGTGLGLSTVHAIVRGHGGFIMVYSEPGKGTTFSVYLPATGDTALSAEATAEHRVHLGEIVGHGELILVVDDEKAIRTITRTTLEKFGYRVVTAADGVQALIAFADGRGEIAAVLTDMMMPALGGVALIDALRRFDGSVKIIAMSGLMPDLKALAKPGTARVPFLHKPYTAEQLLDALAKLLRP